MRVTAQVRACCHHLSCYRHCGARGKLSKKHSRDEGLPRTGQGMQALPAHLLKVSTGLQALQFERPSLSRHHHPLQACIAWVLQI